MADQNTDVTINDSYINTAGTIRTAIWVGDSSKTTVNNSVIYAQETNDDYSTYSELVPSMMKRVPFALGMEGTIRATNVLGAGQAIYNNSMIISTGWGALSTDSGTSYNNTSTYALQVNNSVSGIMIRTETEFSDVPVIFLTSKDDRESVMQVMALKPEGYLLKTMEPARIIAEVDAFFERQKAKLFD